MYGNPVQVPVVRSLAFGKQGSGGNIKGEESSIATKSRNVLWNFQYFVCKNRSTCSFANGVCHKYRYVWQSGASSC
ncbi:hypothetical protein HanPSC8_Chr06g0238021 [Helianthus annuus]|nr:hypothetical protein HanPSC8_Chr06g0238021 [Helianthus annuus]